MVTATVFTCAGKNEAEHLLTSDLLVQLFFCYLYQGFYLKL